MSRPILHSNTRYPKDVDWISFDHFEKWELFDGYAYDTDRKLIDWCLISLQEELNYNLILSELDRDWQDAVQLRDCSLRDNLKHSMRIAGLVLAIPEKGVYPVEIDTFSRAPSKLEGHHRLLALKYLGFSEFPAYLNGWCDYLDFLTQSP